MPHAHDKLDVYRISLRAHKNAVRLTTGIQSGFANDIDQLRRATSSVVRNVAEGAGRWSKADKAARFTVARGEAAEASACVDILAVCGVVDHQLAASVSDDLDRVGAMLTRLIQRNRTG